MNRSSMVLFSLTFILSLSLGCTDDAEPAGGTAGNVPAAPAASIEGAKPAADAPMPTAALTPVRFSASWAMSYDSVGSIAEAADVIVVGTVTGVDGVTEDRRQAGAVDASLVFTDFRIRVDETLKGSTAGTLLVHQTGGISGDTIVEIEDDPLLQAGEQYVLFLLNGSGGTFMVAGGPDGRLVVDDGRTSSLSARFAGRGINDLGLDNVPLSEVRDAIAAARP